MYATRVPVVLHPPNVFAIASDGLKLRFGAARAPPSICGSRSGPRLPMSLTGADQKCLPPRYPQMDAAHLIHERVLADGRKSLIWHHQGSGKTLLMVFAASLLLADTRTDSPRIILLSDRTHLVRQTSGVFTSAMGDAYFHQPPQQQKAAFPAGRRRAWSYLHDRPQVRRRRQEPVDPPQHHRACRRGTPDPVLQ